VYAILCALTYSKKYKQTQNNIFVNSKSILKSIQKHTNFLLVGVVVLCLVALLVGRSVRCVAVLGFFSPSFFLFRRPHHPKTSRAVLFIPPYSTSRKKYKKLAIVLMV